MHCKIAKFQVQNFTSLSNHCPISCSLLSSFTDDHGAHDKLSPLPGNFLWNSSSIEAYTVKFQSQETQQKLQSFIAEDFENSDTAANALSSLLCETASASTILIKGNSPYHKRKTRHKPWFSQSCKELHSTVKKYAELVHMFPFNGSYRKEFYTYKSKFRRLCSTQKKMFKKNICDELLSKIKSDPKSFWQLINELDKSNSSDNTEELNITEFTNFYKKLGSITSKSNNNSHHENVVENLDFLLKDKTNIDNNLNGPILEKEIIKAVRGLKNGKACVSDLIANEMIKYGMPVLLKPLHKLFNFVFDSGSFPKTWNESFISVLHKKGSKHDPGNYRGISLTSNLGKLFNKVIYNRLLEFVNEHNLILQIISSHSSLSLNSINHKRKKFLLHL